MRQSVIAGSAHDMYCFAETVGCIPNPCRNSGICRSVGSRGFSCNCDGTGFTGAECTEGAWLVFTCSLIFLLIPITSEPRVRPKSLHCDLLLWFVACFTWTEVAQPTAAASENDSGGGGGGISSTVYIVIGGSAAFLVLVALFLAYRSKKKREERMMMLAMGSSASLGSISSAGSINSFRW